MHNHTLATVNSTPDSRPLTGSGLSASEQLDQQKKAIENGMEASTKILGNESQWSMVDILSSLDQELHQSIPEPELVADKPMPKLTISNLSAKKSTFCGRKNVSFSFYHIQGNHGYQNSLGILGGWRLYFTIET